MIWIIFSISKLKKIDKATSLLNQMMKEKSNHDLYLEYSNLNVCNDKFIENKNQIQKITNCNLKTQNYDYFWKKIIISMN